MGKSYLETVPIMIITVSENNFMDGLLFCFIFTDVAFYLFDSKFKRLLFIAFGNILFIVICIILGMMAYWYDDILTFFVGAGIAMYKNEFLKLFEGKRYWISTALLLMVLIPSKYLAFNWIYYDISTIITSFAGAVLMVVLLMKFNLKSKVFLFLGGYSWEIYMFHQMFILLGAKVAHRNVIIMIFAIGATILLSIIVQELSKMLREWFDRKILVLGN